MGDKVTTFCDVKRSGVYRCTNCDANQLRLEPGEEAPHCDNCKRPVTWEFVRPLVGRIGF